MAKTPEKLKSTVHQAAFEFADDFKSSPRPLIPPKLPELINVAVNLPHHDFDLWLWFSMTAMLAAGILIGVVLAGVH